MLQPGPDRRCLGDSVHPWLVDAGCCDCFHDLVHICAHTVVKVDDLRGGNTLTIKRHALVHACQPAQVLAQWSLPKSARVAAHASPAKAAMALVSAASTRDWAEVERLLKVGSDSWRQDGIAPLAMCGKHGC